MKLSPNQVHDQLEKVRRRNFGKYLVKIKLSNVRGFRSQEVEFFYPVTALIGTNGGGKSTILGAAALAYKDIAPRTFFPKASVGDDSMAEWKVEYEFIDKELNKDETIQRTARFSQMKWRRDAFPERSVSYIEIQRTVPAGEISRFKRFLGGDPEKIRFSDISEDTIKYASAVLDRDLSKYRIASISDAPEFKMYVCLNPNVGYSQFHFGAGEASVISTIDRIENADNNSLILIEEIENGLHPVATRLFTQYLMEVSRRKRIQVIFTTHSQDAVNELPSEGIWACINFRPFNGRLSIESLRAVTGIAPGKLAIFCEDDLVVDWVTDALGQYASDQFESIKVYPGGGYPNVVNVVKFHNENPTVEIPGIALVDGDIYDPEVNEALPDFAKYLGEGKPESLIFDFIYENRVNFSGIIRQRCLLNAFSEERIVKSIERAYRQAADQHMCFEIMGNDLNFSSSIRIRQGLINIFNENNPEFWRSTIDFVKERL